MPFDDSQLEYFRSKFKRMEPITSAKRSAFNLNAHERLRLRVSTVRRDKPATTASTSTTVGAVFVQEVPESAKKEYERGAELVQKNDRRKEGIEKLKSAVAMFPNYFAALELLGGEYVKAQEYESAVPLLTREVEVNKL